MEIIYSCCCGLDVHKKQVTACVLSRQPGAERRQWIRQFSTYTHGLEQLTEWLQQQGVEQVAMEATGPYWRPVWNILEAAGVRLMLVNAQHVKRVPGRKTDVCDAQWIAELLLHGLLQPNLVPDRKQRELRDLTRTRACLVQDQSRVRNRIQKVLEDANIKLASVVSDPFGVSARAMLERLIAGETDPQQMTKLALGKLRKKVPELAQALAGRLNEHHRFQLRLLGDQLQAIETLLVRIERQIEAHLDARQARAVELLDTIPGLDRTAAVEVVAEIGVNMAPFPSAGHLSSWAAMCPGNHESAGKRLSGKTRKGSRWLRAALCRAAWAGSRKNNSYVKGLYRRLAARRGKKRAIVAVGHSLLVMAYWILKRNQPYQELGEDFFDRLDQRKTIHRLKRRLESLGCSVTLPAPPLPA